MFFRWLKRRRRANVIAPPFPKEWLGFVERNVGYFSLLTEAERKKLRDDLRIFIAETSFEGCGGLTLTDEIKVTIAAQASILVLGFQGAYFERVQSVLVYPTGFRSPDGWRGPDGVIHDEGVGMLGEAWHQGTVILAWDSVFAGGRNAHDGRNVVLHEFAHQIDFLDGFADGMPPLNREQHQRWHDVMRQEYDRLVAESQRGRPTVLDSYGASNHAEFFAVATEAFFESSIELRHRHPQLYEMLKEYYRQDTAGRLSKRDS